MNIVEFLIDRITNLIGFQMDEVVGKSILTKENYVILSVEFLSRQIFNGIIVKKGFTFII